METKIIISGLIPKGFTDEALKALIASVLPDTFRVFSIDVTQTEGTPELNSKPTYTPPVAEEATTTPATGEAASTPTITDAPLTGTVQ